MPKKEDALQPDDVVEAFNLNYNLGSAIVKILQSRNSRNKEKLLDEAINHLKKEKGNEKDLCPIVLPNHM